MTDRKPLAYIVLELQDGHPWDTNERWEPIAVYQREEEAHEVAAVNPMRYKVVDAWYYAAKEAA